MGGGGGPAVLVGERTLVLVVGWRALDLGGGALRACVSFVLRWIGPNDGNDATRQVPIYDDFPEV